MGKIKCLNCGSELTMISSAACPSCGVRLSHVKISFLSYLGPEDSLAGYQRSYKLVLLKSLFEEFLSSKTLPIQPIVERFKTYYLQRKQAGLLIDKDVDNRIAEIEKSTLHDVFLLIKMNPYAAINKHGFLKIDEFNHVFVLQRGIDDLSDEEVRGLLNLLEKKLKFYYEKIGTASAKSQISLPLTSSSPAGNESDSIDVHTKEESAPEVITASSDAQVDLNSLAIEKLHLSTRAYNALRRNGVHTAADMETVFENGQLYQFRHVGAGTIEEIAELLRRLKSGNIFDATEHSENPTQNTAEDLSIEAGFPGTAYAMFRDYCEHHAISTLADLEGFNFSKLLDIRGFGPGKVERIEHRYEIMCSGHHRENTGSHKTECTEPNTCPFASIHSSNYSLSVSVLRFWDVSPGILKDLEDNDIVSLANLAEAHENDLLRILGKARYRAVKDAAENLCCPLSSLAEEILKDCSQNKGFDIYVRRSEGCTLQEIADAYNVTRERVRQICLSIERKIRSVMLAIAEAVSAENGGGYCTEEQILDVFDNDDYDKVIVLALKNSDVYDYLDFAEVFVNKAVFPDAEEALCRLANSIVGEGINLFEELSTIEKSLADSGFSFITADAFIELLIKHDYKFYGDYAVKSRKSYGRLCAEIVADEFPNGIHITNDEDIAHLRASLETKYGKLDVPENNRSFISRVVVFLVQSGRSTYISPRNIMIDDAVLQEIKAYIDTLPYQDIYYSQIFAEYEGLLMMTSNVDNAGFLHGVLAWRYPDDYVYSRDYLRKPDAEETATLSEQIKNLLAETGRPLSKKEIMDHFPGRTDAMFNNAFYYTPGLLQWDSGVFTCADNFSISTSDIPKFRQVIQNILDANGGYCSQERLYRHALREVPNLCVCNHVSSSQNVFCIAAHLFNDVFEFSRPHLAIKGRFKELDVKTIALEILGHPDILNANAFYALARKFEWSEITAGFVFSNIEKGYVRLSKNTYQKAESFTLTEEDKTYISELLSQTAENEWYLSLQRFADSDEITPGGISINDFVMNSIISRYSFGWHVVSPQAKDRRYEKGVLVKDAQGITAYDQLVAQVLADAGIRTLTASQMLSFLQIHQLTFKTIPKELEVSDYFSVSNDQFSLT